MAVAGALVVRMSGQEETPTAVAALPPSTAALAMLQVEDVGAGFAPGENEALSYLAQAPGCLRAVRAIVESSGASIRVERTFTGPVTEPPAAVSSQVSSYPDRAMAEAALATFRDTTRGCTKVGTAQTTRGFRLAVRSEDRRAPGFDEQVRVSAVGALRGARGYPIGLWMSVTRVENHLAIVRSVSVSGVESDASESQNADRIDALTTAAASRLRSFS